MPKEEFWYQLKCDPKLSHQKKAVSVFVCIVFVRVCVHLSHLVHLITIDFSCKHITHICQIQDKSAMS